MGNEHVNVRPFQPITLEQLEAKFGLLAHGEFEDLLAVLVHVVHFVGDSFFAAGMQAAAARHIQELSARAVDLMNEINESFVIVLGRFEHGRTRAVPEDNAGGPIGVVDDR